jgi:hypothetical protein
MRYALLVGVALLAACAQPTPQAQVAEPGVPATLENRMPICIQRRMRGGETEAQAMRYCRCAIDAMERVYTPDEVAFLIDNAALARDRNRAVALDARGEQAFVASCGR